MKALITILNNSITRSVGKILFLMIVILLFVSAIHYKNNAVTGGLEIEIMKMEADKNLIIKDEIYDWLGSKFTDNFEFQEVNNLHIREFEKVLESHPSVDRVDVYVDAQNIVSVHVHQKEPVFRVMNDDGSYYMTKQGSRFPISKHYTARSIILSGAVPTESEELSEEQVQRIEQITKLYEFLEDDTFYLTLIDHIQVQGNGDFIIIPVVGDFQIKFGNIEYADDKLMRIKEFYKRILKTKDWGTYEYIDLRFNHQVIAKRK